MRDSAADAPLLPDELAARRIRHHGLDGRPPSRVVGLHPVTFRESRTRPGQLEVARGDGPPVYMPRRPRPEPPAAA